MAFFSYFQVNSENAVWKKEQMRHLTMKKTPMSNGKLKSANGTSRNAGVADFMCLCLTFMNIQSAHVSISSP